MASISFGKVKKEIRNLFRGGLIFIGKVETDPFSLLLRFLEG